MNTFLWIVACWLYASVFFFFGLVVMGSIKNRLEPRPVYQTCRVITLDRHEYSRV